MANGKEASWLRKWQVWVVLVIVGAVAAFYLGGVNVWNWAKQFFTGVEYSATIVFTNLFGLLFGILLAVVAYFLGAVEPKPADVQSSDHDSGKLWRILGWAIAIVYTPFGTSDAESLDTIMKTLSVFLSGYLVSKIDRFLEGTLFVAGKPTVQWAPLGLFATAFLLSTIVVFVNRVYMNDVNRTTEVSFSVPSGSSQFVFGSEKIAVKEGKLLVNDVEIEKETVKLGDFVKLYPRTRRLEINGKNVGKAAIPKKVEVSKNEEPPKKDESTKKDK
jgi:hypothetical protein